MRAYAGGRFASFTLQRQVRGSPRDSLNPEYLLAGSIDLFKPLTPGASPCPPPLRTVSYKDNPVNRVGFWVTCQVPV